MTFLYHGISENMEGSELVPLNQMFIKNPELHQKYLEKYKGREGVIEKRIALLDCTWSDVVQLLPLDPRKLFDLQHQLGLITEIPDYRYFQIDSSNLNQDSAVVYFKTAPGEENVTIKWLKDVDFDSLQEIPEATVKYYESMVGTGEPVFNYQFVPHVLYKGAIDVSESETTSIRK
jgi:hypothetical protein